MALDVRPIECCTSLECEGVRRAMLDHRWVKVNSAVVVEIVFGTPVAEGQFR